MCLDSFNRCEGSVALSASNTTTTGINELSAGPGGSTMVTPTTSTSTSNHECILELTFNNQNIVTDFNTWKSDRLACNRLYGRRR